MKNIINELKNIYEEASDSLWALKEKYSNIEKKMKSNIDLEEKHKIAESFLDFEYKDIKEQTEQVKEAVQKLTNPKECADAIAKNSQVKTAYQSYLVALEEAEYIYPHAKGAVSIFLRDNAPSNEQ